MYKKIATICLALVMVITFSACTGEAPKEAGLPSTQEIVDGVLGSLDSIKTFKFDMDMSLDMSGETEGDKFDVTMVMDSQATVDFENRTMEMDMTMDMVLPEEGDMEIGMKYYLIGDMMYMLLDIPEIGPMWMKSELPSGSWGKMSQAESQIDLLKTAEVRVIGSEEIRGVDCFVLQLDPDMDQLWQMAMQQAELGGEETLPDVPEEFFQEMFRSFSVKQWISKDNYYFIKTKIDMTVELTAEAMKVREGGMSMDIAINLLTYDYNESVSVVLPPEAETAMEIPMQ